MIDSLYYEAQCYIRGTSLAATYNYCNGEKSGYTYYVQNAHGDVVNLTDADGAVTKTYRYDAFGVELNPVTGDINVFRYCGEYFDTETGSIYLRARYYQASIGRFTQRDTVAGKLGDPLSLNLYTYAHNNPIFYFDPSGHKAGKSTNGFGGNGWHGYPEYDNKFDEFKHVMKIAFKVTAKECMIKSKGHVDELYSREISNYHVNSRGYSLTWGLSHVGRVYSGGLYYDNLGNFGFKYSYGSDFNTTYDLNASWVEYKSEDYLQDISEIGGLGGNIGASINPFFFVEDFSARLITIGADVNFVSSNDKWKMTGVTQSKGVGISISSEDIAKGNKITPDESFSPGIHGSITTTNYYNCSSLNWYDNYNRLYDTIMKW